MQILSLCFWSTVILATLSLAANAQQFPAAGHKDMPDPITSPDAEPGGEIVAFIGQSPKSFNNYLETSYSTARIFSLMYDALLGSDSLDLSYTPGLAASWSISEDKTVFTFTMDEHAKWSDGKAVTAHDVAYTFAMIMDEKHLTGPHKVHLERFQPPKVLSDSQIQFTAKEAHWKNLGALGELRVLPKHAFADQDFNKVNFDFPVVSGPYKRGELKDGIYVVMERREDWWARRYLRTQGLYNFDRIRIRFFAERENAYDAFKKGQIDLFPVYTSHRWVNQTSGDKFDKNWIVKQKVSNANPIGFQGFAMNMRRELFRDIRVRRALSLLLDRGKMNATLMHNLYFLHRSYYEDLYSDSNPCPNPAFAFDTAAARVLLSEAGWKANPKTGLLEKDGKVFRFKFLTRSASTDRFLAIFKEDLKDVGIEIEVDRKDWAAWVKDMDEFNYDMTWAAWGASVRKDPEGMWSSKEAERKAGNNITGFKNDRVDELLVKQRTILDVNTRHAMVREIDGIVYEQCPYILLWNINYTRLLYWNKFGTPATVLSKFDDESAALEYWWFDEDSAADLEDAQADNAALPKQPYDVQFNKQFQAP